MWCVPELNEKYITRMEDILNLYEKPLNKKEPVVCFDEKAIQLLGEKRIGRTTNSPGKPRTTDYEYVRNGTANIFCAVEPKGGKHITGVKKRRRGREFAQFLNRIARNYSSAKTIHLVLDNLSTHSLKSLTDYFGEKKGNKIWNRFTIHNTPTHASWLNQAEIEIFKCTKQCIGKRRFSDIKILTEEVKSWQKNANIKKDKINWQFTSRKARKKFNYKI